MTFFNLALHPSCVTLAASTVAVMVERSGSEVLLRYDLSDPTDVAWPEAAAPGRADELWRFTCFELFLVHDNGERYVEFNFSPSGRWAAYAFDGYRSDMADLAMRREPIVTRIRGGVDVVCPIDDLPRGDFRMGLSAVIKQTDGTKSYWALAHAPGPPDFHNPACFTATLPPPPGA